VGSGLDISLREGQEGQGQTKFQVSGGIFGKYARGLSDLKEGQEKGMGRPSSKFLGAFSGNTRAD
jgi:hypothetical protein